MSKISRATWGLASALLLSFAVGACTTVAMAPSPELQPQIESARSAPDHLALASYYGREAVGARASAVEHRKRGQSYPVNVGSRGSGSMRAHCNEIARNFDSIAAEYDALAMDHQGLAAQVKP